MAAVIAPMTAAPVALHATALVVGETGVLIRGVSGSGKTSLALAVLAEARRHHRFAGLVGDDRVLVEVRNGRVVARSHPAILGQVEMRGIGIRRIDCEPACVLGLVVDLVTAVDRLGARCPDVPPVADLCGITLPVLTFPATEGGCAASTRLLAFMFAVRQNGSE